MLERGVQPGPLSGRALGVKCGQRGRPCRPERPPVSATSGGPPALGGCPSFPARGCSSERISLKPTPYPLRMQRPACPAAPWTGSSCRNEPGQRQGHASRDTTRRARDAQPAAQPVPSDRSCASMSFQPARWCGVPSPGGDRQHPDGAEARGRGVPQRLPHPVRTRHSFWSPLPIFYLTSRMSLLNRIRHLQVDQSGRVCWWHLSLPGLLDGQWGQAA